MASFTLSVFSRKCFWVREVDHNKKTAIIMMHLHWNNCLQASACLAALLKAQMFMEVRQQDDVSCVASRKWLLLQLVGNCWKMHYRSDTGNKACATLKDKYPVCILCVVPLHVQKVDGAATLVFAHVTHVTLPCSTAPPLKHNPPQGGHAGSSNNGWALWPWWHFISPVCQASVMSLLRTNDSFQKQWGGWTSSHYTVKLVSRLRENCFYYVFNHIHLSSWLSVMQICPK